ncbi:Zinc finger CCCH domain-containing protein 58 [Raphanus sativus]|uniref:Zinc finger CCCH domain-containing protein 58 n=1 Tax=Raphanus sativus TaxID=3726 RepID=A0A6J0L4W3_RAPSA|nr:zinc finger CCCH domain-containing protein 58 [Raphanus sativus]KAJ4910683.1 Zinc finger CCCH domain-containing protein 58 [Raphanus sativus]
MERYGRAGEQGSRSDPSLETGIQGSMWRLGLGGGGGESYPERLSEPDCIYYLRTGVCGYGSRCRFHHPRNRAPVLGGLRTTEAGEFPERMGQPVCQHFMRTGTCRFGATCKYHHPRQGGRDSFTNPVSLSYMGFPLRPGEKECSFYMRTGQCKFGSTCRFHHPVPPGVQAPSHQQLSTGSAIYPPLQSQSLPSSQQFGVTIPRPQLLPGSYLQSPYGYNQMLLPPPPPPPPGMVPYSGWNPYQASLSTMPSPGTQPSMGSSSIYGIRPLSPPAPAYPSSNNEQTFPQRPGQPECQYFMRTGDCKFGTSCRFHHPLEAASPKGVSLSHIGLPLRPGTAQCSHFAQHGFCKFGPACKFDHSMASSSLSYSPSASSLTDMPVPYPLGSSSLLTLAPSSSSSMSDQRTELHSSSSIKPTNTTSGGSETLASSMASGVSHSESAESKNGDSASIEVKTSS